MTASQAEATEQQRPVVIGTAGHVDHGKSTLVRALTGIDPDRLAEEKARSMTIDLGFAWFALPGGRSASIVDVPGHEHFIKNMLAGIGGIDLAMLVVAADEGPMPQTREHLAIIDLLGIESGVVALTKADLAEPDLIDYVAEEIGDLLAGTGLAGSPVIPVSGITGEGLDRLRDALERVAAGQDPHSVHGPARMPIDRIFSVAGFGTVVTGTVLGGSFAAGDELVVMPDEKQVRVRGVQSHQHAIPRVSAGMRAAINLSGIETEHIRRGDVLAKPNALTAAHRVDVQVRLLDNAPVSLPQNARVDFFTGAAESPAQLTLLEADALEPGDTQFVQIRLAQALAMGVGDRFIIRQASPSLTIGGGVILDPSPAKHRRFDQKTLHRLTGQVQGDPLTLVRTLLSDRVVRQDVIVREIAATVGTESAEEAVATLLRQGELTSMHAPGTQDAPFIINSVVLDNLAHMLGARIDTFHQDNPLLPGLPLKDVRGVVRLEPKPFDALLAMLEARGVCVRDGAAVRRQGFVVTLDENHRRRVEPYLEALQEHPFSPPAPQEFGIEFELLSAIDHLGLVVRLSDTIAFDPDAFAHLITVTLDHLASHGTITMAEFRDLVGTTRKYAQPVLEEFDRLRLTRRVGDVRHRGSAPSSVSR